MAGGVVLVWVLAGVMCVVMSPWLLRRWLREQPRGDVAMMAAGFCTVGLVGVVVWMVPAIGPLLHECCTTGGDTLARSCPYML